MKDINELLNFGVINIDKPVGPTSFGVSEFVRKKLGLGKTSHMGTLDPKVSGVLPITLGRACKLAEYLIRHDKTYVGILEVHKVCDIVELQKLIDSNFVGKIRQVPPHRSAVARRERIREVFYWRLLEASENRKSFLFECRVEGGTYIRKLCSDLGEMIGGAHMRSLRRIKAGIFSEGLGDSGEVSGKFVDLYEFEKAVESWENGNNLLLRKIVVPAEDVVKKVLSVVEVEKEAMKSLCVGKPLLESSIVGSAEIEEEKSFAVFCGKVFVGVYRKSSEKGIFGRAEFVKN